LFVPLGRFFAIVVIGISPRDGAARTSCTWKLRGGARPEIEIAYPDGRAESVPVVSVDGKRLLVKPVQ